MSDRDLIGILGMVLGGVLALGLVLLRSGCAPISAI